MRKIDYTKPVRLTEPRPRSIKVEAVTNDGFAIVSSPRFNSGWMMFTPEGTYAYSPNGQGMGLKVEQDPDHILDEIEDRLAKSSIASFLLYREDLEALVKLAREGSR